MNELAAGWCPSCAEFTVIDPGQPCAWCGTIVVRKRGGWQRPDARARSRISPAHARALHAAHAGGVSLRELSRQVYARLGYASADSCLEGIRAAFAREGLAVREHAVATAAANRARGHRLPGEDKNAYRRRLRRELKAAAA